MAGKPTWHMRAQEKLRTRNQTFKTGFTLIELLVVVTIIAILASLLLPSLQRTKEKAKTSLCANNLKTLAQAANMYFEDHDGYAPRISEVYPFTKPHTITFAQALCRLNYLAANTNNMWHWDVGGTRPVPPLRCPSEPFYPTAPPWFYSWYSGHYGFSQYFSAWGSVMPTGFYQRPGHAPKPALAYLVADASTGGGIHWDKNPDYHGWRARHGLPRQSMNQRNPYGIVNVGFLDGHVETLPFTNILLSTTTPTSPVWTGGLTGGPASH